MQKYDPMTEYEFTDEEEEILDLIYNNCKHTNRHTNLRDAYDKMEGWGGHCYHVAEVIYLLFAKDKGFKPVITFSGDKIAGSSHWWLVNPDTNEYIDVTAYNDDNEQYEFKKWLSQPPSKRARNLIAAIQSDITLSEFF